MARSSPITLSCDVFLHHLFTRRPFLASYKLTYRCNLRCQQCPFVNYPGKDPSFDQVCETLDRLHQRGDRVVVFEGGEPLLWRDGSYYFEDVVQYAKRYFACVAVTTNGTLTTETAIDVLWVSIDGFAETHNRLRQGNIFDRVIENIRRSQHPRIYAHITANAENHAEIPALVRWLTEARLVKGITVQFYYPYSADDALFLHWPERRALLDELVRLKQRGYPVLNSIPSLRALRDNHWRCLPHRIDCADPNGSIRQGCYLQNRSEIDCDKCGFSPYTELSLAFQGNPAAILAGFNIFLRQ